MDIADLKKLAGISNKIEMKSITAHAPITAKHRTDEWFKQVFPTMTNSLQMPTGFRGRKNVNKRIV